ncbi:hypothetical protein ACIRBX_01275 [Kitasatospora sp. NPDC096147]|uniref:hypothetical protein n=1 Tax=Kitasatospora sp. NPDC096147 TaxID=3364093 RepID=UPI00382EB259
MSDRARTVLAFCFCAAFLTGCVLAAGLVWTRWLSPEHDQALVKARESVLSVSRGAVAELDRTYRQAAPGEAVALARYAAIAYGTAHGATVRTEDAPGAVRLTVDLERYADVSFFGAPVGAKVRSCFDWTLPAGTAAATVRDVPCPLSADLDAVLMVRHL